MAGVPGGWPEGLGAAGGPGGSRAEPPSQSPTRHCPRRRSDWSAQDGITDANHSDKAPHTAPPETRGAPPLREDEAAPLAGLTGLSEPQAGDTDVSKPRVPPPLQALEHPEADVPPALVPRRRLARPQPHAVWCEHTFSTCS